MLAEERDIPMTKRRRAEAAGRDVALHLRP